MVKGSVQHLDMLGLTCEASCRTLHGAVYSKVHFAHCIYSSEIQQKRLGSQAKLAIFLHSCHFFTLWLINLIWVWLAMRLGCSLAGYSVALPLTLPVVYFGTKLGS